MHMTISDITGYIKKELPEKLQKDLQSLKIVKEADIECSAYYHLRRFIGERTEWRVLARKHIPITGHFIDLLVFKNETPVIAIELKWAKLAITDKDRASLEKAINNLGVQKAYWSSMVTREECDKPSKLKNDKYRLFQIVIPLGLDEPDKDSWTERRKKFRGEMKAGRNAQ